MCFRYTSAILGKDKDLKQWLGFQIALDKGHMQHRCYRKREKNLALNKWTDLHIAFVEMTCTNSFDLLYQVKLLGNVVCVWWERWIAWGNTSYQKNLTGFWPIVTMSIKGTTACLTQLHYWELHRTKPRWGSHTWLCLVLPSHCSLKNLTNCFTTAWNTYIHFVSITFYVNLALWSVGCWGIKPQRLLKNSSSLMNAITDVCCS